MYDFICMMIEPWYRCSVSAVTNTLMDPYTSEQWHFKCPESLTLHHPFFTQGNRCVSRSIVDDYYPHYTQNTHERLHSAAVPRDSGCLVCNGVAGVRRISLAVFVLICYAECRAALGTFVLCLQVFDHVYITIES